VQHELIGQFRRQQAAGPRADRDEHRVRADHIAVGETHGRAVHVDADGPAARMQLSVRIQAQPGGAGGQDPVREQDSGLEFEHRARPGRKPDLRVVRGQIVRAEQPRPGAGVGQHPARLYGILGRQHSVSRQHGQRADTLVEAG
jgi:hypothetical protein